MNKLLMVTTIPGTLRAFFLPFGYHFRAKGWQVDAMACGVSNCAECLEAFDRVWDIEWSRNPLDPRNLMVAPSRVREIILNNQYDIVHVFTPVAAFVTRYALKELSKQAKLQVIYTALGFHFFKGRKLLKNTIFLTLEKLAARWTDYLVVVNGEDEEAAKRYRFLPPEKICPIPSGIGRNLSRFNPDAVAEAEIREVRQELGIAENNPLFLSVAEFSARKHPQDVLRGFARLARSEAHLAFAGDGPLMEKMEQLATNLGIQNQVHFLGVRRDIPRLMRASTAVILASEQEGLPISVIESLCLETPVIGTDIRGTRDLLAEGCGLLVKVEDIEGLARAMAWILDHPEEARMMGKRGREHMVIYDIKHVLSLHETLYAEALKKVKKS
ncbi:glycosyltransferase [Pleurocapsales cyanobacterium LEGE 06147]|nr:glycosyltransferase [Pleurocapsales cyanobacterium LEGE 06147]